MERIKKILPADRKTFENARQQWNSIAKPLNGLGQLEDDICRIAAIQGTSNVDISKRAAVIMCADNGVTAENVTQSDSFVTAICAEEIAAGNSSINKLAKAFNAEVIAVDMGIKNNISNSKIINKKISHGTKNIANGAAMTRSQAEKSICVGMDIVRKLKNDGVKIIVSGEMGIGNTTTAAAISAVMLGVSPDIVTGRGAGLDSAGLSRKISVIKKAIAINSPDKNDPIDVLSKLGGFDIGGMTGLFLGGAVYKIPIIIDGIISSVSALLACEICPICKEYMLASHVSEEPAAKLILEKIGLKPIINAGFRLGEGTGGIMLLPLLDGAISVYKNAHKFDEIGIERYVELK